MAIPSAIATKIIALPKLFSFSLMAPMAAAAALLTAMPVPMAASPVASAAPINAAATAISEAADAVAGFAETLPENITTVASMNMAENETKFTHMASLPRFFSITNGAIIESRSSTVIVIICDQLFLIQPTPFWNQLNYFIRLGAKLRPPPL